MCTRYPHSAQLHAGLLEGAHTGHGLGHEFLRHIQRCRALVHIIDGSSLDPVGDYDAIRTELELFNPELVGKPSVSACVSLQSVMVRAACILPTSKQRRLGAGKEYRSYRS